jgi:DNA-binding CsgD family transcriptional regulator
MVGFDEMRRALRLALDLRDFVPGTEDQCRHLSASVGSMVGACVTMCLEIEGVPHAPRIVDVYDQGWSDAGTRKHFVAYVANQAHRQDPLALGISNASRPGQVVTRARRQLVEDKAWYQSEHVDEYRHPSGLDDCIYSIFVGPRMSRCLSMHRPWNGKPFTERDRALVHVLHTECAALLEKNADLAIVETLNRRLRQTLEGLVRGLSEKQLADELALSQHTLHGYVKTLYRRLGVSSRGELHARFDRLIRSQ